MIWLLQQPRYPPFSRIHASLPSDCGVLIACVESVSLPFDSEFGHDSEWDICQCNPRGTNCKTALVCPCSYSSSQPSPWQPCLCWPVGGQDTCTGSLCSYMHLLSESMLLGISWESPVCRGKNNHLVSAQARELSKYCGLKPWSLGWFAL